MATDYAGEEPVRAERETRGYALGGLREWARQVLADESTVVLDTETTGLHDEARIVEISVIRADERVLLNTLISPGEPISADATRIHGIGDQDVATAPSFSNVLARLTAALDRKRVIIYNAPYDVGRLRHELHLHYSARWVNLVKRGSHHHAAAWLEAMRFEDVMMPYSEYVGEWNHRFGTYQRQPLDGGHRALDDCRAVIDRLQEIAEGRGFPLATENSRPNSRMEWP